MPECIKCGNKKMERIWDMEDDKTYWHCYKCGRKYAECDLNV